MTIQSGRCPYCGASYDVYEGCYFKCADSQKAAQLISDAADDDPGEEDEEAYLRYTPEAEL